VNRTYPKILRNRKQRIARRLKVKHWEDQPCPMLKASNIHYEMAERTAATSCGGIGAMHLLVQRLGLVEDMNRSLHLLKVHLPYHESDHVLNLTYNLLAGCTAADCGRGVSANGGTERWGHPHRAAHKSETLLTRASKQNSPRVNQDFQAQNKVT